MLMEFGLCHRWVWDDYGCCWTVDVSNGLANAVVIWEHGPVSPCVVCTLERVVFNDLHMLFDVFVIHEHSVYPTETGTFFLMTNTDGIMLIESRSAEASRAEPNKHTHRAVSKPFQLPDSLCVAHTHIWQRPCANAVKLLKGYKNAS